jgi:outer membrane protein with glycine zipper
MTCRFVLRLALAAGAWGCSRAPSRAPGSTDTTSLAPIGDSGSAEELRGGERQTRSGSQPGTVAASARAQVPARSTGVAHARSRAAARRPPAGTHTEPTTQGYRPSADSTAPAPTDSGLGAAAGSARGHAPDNADTATDARKAVGDSVIPSASSEPKPAAATSSPGAGAASPAATPESAATPALANALPAGTQVRAILQDSITSLRNSVGQTVIAIVSGDLRAPDGLAVLPSGSVVRLTIERLSPARTRSAKDGELLLRADSVLAQGHTYRVSAAVQPIPHELRGRGVTAGEAEKVGAGAAAGAVIGGVVTGKTKGAVVGGAVGAVGGAVVAAQTASRDVVVAPRTLITLILRAPVVRVE